MRRLSPLLVAQAIAALAQGGLQNPLTEDLDTAGFKLLVDATSYVLIEAGIVSLAANSSVMIRDDDAVGEVWELAYSGVSANLTARGTLNAKIAAGAKQWWFDRATGYFGVGTSAPTAGVDISADMIRIRSPRTPASSADAGNPGEIAWDNGFLYVCVAADTWKRAALSTW